LLIFKDRFPKLEITNIITALLLIVFGATLLQFHNQVKTTEPFKQHYVKNVIVYGAIEKVHLMREKEISFILKSDSIKKGNSLLVGEFRIICKIRDSSRFSLRKKFEKIQVDSKVIIIGNYLKASERRNPGEFDFRKYSLKQGLSGSIVTPSVNNLILITESSNTIANLILDIRKSIAYRIEKIHSTKANGLLKGLILGDKSEIDYETQEEFINSGVAHVLAVSGQQVSFIALIFILIFGRFNLFLRGLITLIGLFFFLIITGSQPAVVRATIMATVYIFSYFFNRDTNPINSIAIAALIILLFSPNELFNPSFQLSFVAVLSTIGIYPFFKKFIITLGIKNSFIKLILSLLFLSLSAQVGIIPFTNMYFGKFSIVAILTNLIVIPGITLILANGIVTLLLSMVSISTAYYFALTGNFLVKYLYVLIKYSAHQSFSFIQIHSYNEFDAVIFYSFLIIVLIYFKKFENTIPKLCLILLVAANVYIFSQVNDKKILSDGKLNVLMVDVGQGDAFIIKFPDGKTALIDAGNANISFDYGKRVILPLLNYLDIDKVDFGFISHLDSDHYLGYISLIDNNRIKSIIKPMLNLDNKKNLVLEKYLQLNNVVFRNIDDTVFNISGCKIYSLRGFGKFDSKISMNDQSLILKLVYGNTSILFTGDAGIKREYSILKKYSALIKSDVLKIAHHGSKYCTSREFLQVISPRICLISVGRINSFNHPSQIVINRMKGREIFRTDLEGAVLLQSDGLKFDKVNWKQ
jgi:competence protein ComEC